MTNARQIRKTLREPVWRVANTVMRPTAGLRVLPDYLIIGAQRCGTTSLQDVVTEHPNVTSSRLMKGVHYFDTGYEHGLDWYRTHFPTRVYANRRLRTTGTPLRVGEASPYYIFHPTALERIQKDLPGVKLIALLRDPVERTLSHYKHEVRRDNETLGLEEALDAEPGRLAGEADRIRKDTGYNSHALQTYSYVARSRYADQVRRMKDLFPDNQTLVLQSEQFFEHPDEVYRRVLAFLDVPPFEPGEFPRMNATKSETAPPEIIERLRAEFHDSNEELYALLGERFSWQ